MGVKGCRLWAMGQLDSNVQSPAALMAAARTPPSACNTWMLTSTCERGSSSVIVTEGRTHSRGGVRLVTWTIPACYVDQPCCHRLVVATIRHTAIIGLHSLPGGVRLVTWAVIINWFFSFSVYHTIAVSSACLMTKPISTDLRSPLVRRRRSPVLNDAMLNSTCTTMRSCSEPGGGLARRRSSPLITLILCSHKQKHLDGSLWVT
jgi:hypothetical protein